jgi:hypothetical protein
MNVDARYQTVRFRSCVNVTAYRTSPALNEDTALTEQRVGIDPGLLAGVSLSLPFPANTHKTLVSCRFTLHLGPKFAHLRKSSVLVAPMVVDFIRKSYSNIRKIHQFIKIVTD